MVAAFTLLLPCAMALSADRAVRPKMIWTMLKKKTAIRPINDLWEVKRPACAALNWAISDQRNRALQNISTALVTASLIKARCSGKFMRFSSSRLIIDPASSSTAGIWVSFRTTS